MKNITDKAFEEADKEYEEWLIDHSSEDWYMNNLRRKDLIINKLCILAEQLHLNHTNHVMSEKIQLQQLLSETEEVDAKLKGWL